jgi:hypothetical protein
MKIDFSRRNSVQTVKFEHGARGVALTTYVRLVAGPAGRIS